MAISSEHGPDLEDVMTASLCERLVGAWELIDLVEEPLDGSASRYPLGERAVGLIVYTADGHMSVQIMQEGHASPGEDDPYGRTADDYAAEARTYFAYAGRYTVDEARGVVTHGVRMSLFPGWVGQDQERAAGLEGDVLTLSGAGSSVSAGVPVRTRLRWRRAGGAAVTSGATSSPRSSR
jgi:hypothetical protein